MNKHNVQNYISNEEDLNRYRNQLSQMQQNTPQIYPQEHSQQQIPQEQNPFNTGQYQNLGIPDVPIQFGGGMTEVLLGDTEVPEPIKKKFWFVFNRDNVLTFLDDDRKRSKLLNFDITKIDMLNSIPYYDYTFNFELQWNIIRNAFETKLDRAVGFKSSNIKNERIVLQSQFQEMRQISETGNDNNIKEGFFRRLLGRR